MGAMSAFASVRAQQQFADYHHKARQGGKTDAMRQLLGVAPDATPEEIRAAFTRKVKETHPDSGGTGGDIQQLKQARNLLLEAHRLPKENIATMHSCQMCSGKGRVTVGFDNQPCTTCNGTGEVSR